MHIRGIILAAGSSKRMGKNKLTMELSGVPVIETVINNARHSTLDEVIIVFGKYDVVTSIKKVYNPFYAEGMSTSIKKGLEGYLGDGVLILLGDMPFITTAIINSICECFRNQSKGIVIPVHNGKRGNPVLLGKKYFEALLQNCGDVGAREIIKRNLEDVAFVEAPDSSIFIDIDDEESFRKLTKY